ncbi:MAG: hypothetical protein JW881_08550 [Spirochaetales bacterium]|nr:hypothetical protein [Spirochaetales bacterium]
MKNRCKKSPGRHITGIAMSCFVPPLLLVSSFLFSDVHLGIDMAANLDIDALVSGDTEMVFHMEEDFRYGAHTEITFDKLGIGMLLLLVNYPGYDALGNPIYTFIVFDFSVFAAFHFLGGEAKIDPFMEIGMGTVQWRFGKGYGLITEDEAALLGTCVYVCSGAGIAIRFFSFSTGIKAIIHPFTFNPRPDLPEYRFEFLKLVLFLDFSF